MKRFALTCLGLASLASAGCCCGSMGGPGYGTPYYQPAPVTSSYYAPAYTSQASVISSAPVASTAVPTTYVSGPPVQTSALVPLESLPTW